MGGGSSDWVDDSRMLLEAEMAGPAEALGGAQRHQAGPLDFWTEHWVAGEVTLRKGSLRGQEEAPVGQVLERHAVPLPEPPHTPRAEGEAGRRQSVWFRRRWEQR